jgi:hypothetical protein
MLANAAQVPLCSACRIWHRPVRRGYCRIHGLDGSRSAPEDAARIKSSHAGHDAAALLLHACVCWVRTQRCTNHFNSTSSNQSGDAATLVACLKKRA